MNLSAIRGRARALALVPAGEAVTLWTPPRECMGNVATFSMSDAP